MAGTAGRSGRRPKPTARKALAGNPGKRALNKDEPVFTPIKGVEPPEWFAEEELPLPEQKKIERVLRDVGLSRTQAKAFMAGGYSALSLRDAEDVGSALNALKNLNF
ncbi:phage major capsid, HK97 family domain protein [Escherichia coli 3-373-03_S3_C3]|nr:phage major capsid, HK97 family domain protein [Escherichia coli 3-373-03_S3_C3]KDU12491.1 phage major capsid, HK97 family domain protein [Escherichia coli 3-373-03_S3_C2]HAW2039272.1 hypothetical protein [Escherichia coli]HAW2043352.1 hypothetical protein [Escherichia coli]HAW2043697.1 hypothetical protein [Escherichia coli]